MGFPFGNAAASLFKHQRVARAPAASAFLLQCLVLDQVSDVAQSGVGGTSCQLGPPGRGQLPLETIEQPVEYFDLPFVERLGGKALPKSGLLED
jgi:hypothetical protein